MRKFDWIVCVLVLVVTVDGVFSAGVLKRDENPKDEEDIYGELDENEGDLQKDQNPDYYESEGSDEETPQEIANSIDVKLTSKPENFTKQIGNEVYLPCLASTKDELVRMWSKDSTPIFQGVIKLGNKNNYEVFNNGTLKVKLESAEDAGEYSCKLVVSEAVKPEVVHQISLQVSPNITRIYSSAPRNEVENGDELSLTCEATGTPTPRISWHKGSDKLATDGRTLTISSVKPKHAGTYRCLADNDVGKPDHGHIEVFVKHIPIISVDRYYVNSDHGSGAELVCDVKGFPVATVNWYFNGEPIPNDDHRIRNQKTSNSDRNALIISDISEKDFGKYTCEATNSLGGQNRTITLTKIPVFANFDHKTAEKDVVLEWKVESKKPITMHEIQYRRKGETNWKFISPEVGNENNDVYLIKHTLKNLEPGTYETRARSKNDHGWSEFSQIMAFQSAKHGSHHPKAKHPKKELKDNQTQDSIQETRQHRTEEVLQAAESTSRGPSFVSSVALVVLALLSIQVRQ